MYSLQADLEVEHPDRLWSLDEWLPERYGACSVCRRPKIGESGQEGRNRGNDEYL